MRKIYFFSTILSLFFSFSSTTSFGQFSKNDVQFWVGSGPDSVILVVDFNDNTPTPSHAWGFLFDASLNVSFNNLLDSFNVKVPQFISNTAGGFLNDISYKEHEAIGGTNNYYWATYSGASFQNLTMNAGITEILSNGNFYACSFTDWDSNPPFDPLQTISNPIAAVNFSAEISKSQLEQKIQIQNHKNTLDIFAENSSISLYTLNGQKVSEGNNKLVLSNLPSGLYLLNFEFSDANISKKIVIY